MFIPDCKSTDHWQTPGSVKKAITRNIIQFWVLYDPCPNNPEKNGLDHGIIWRSNNYVNPPYSKGHQLKWAQECVYRINIREIDLCLLLIRFDPSTDHFKYMMGKCQIVWMLDKRPKFIGALDSYNFPIVLYQIQKHPPKWPVFQFLNI